MKKRFKFLIAMMVISTLFCACSKDEKKDKKEIDVETKLEDTESISAYNLPKIDEDYFRVFADDLKFKQSDVSVIGSVSVTILSSNPISKDELKITNNGNEYTNWVIGESEEDTMSIDVLGAYQNKVIDTDEYDKIKNKLPKMYSTVLALDIVELKGSELAIEYTGEKYKFDISGIEHDAKTDLKTDSALESKSLAKDDMNVHNILSGELYIDKNEYSVAKDIDLSKVYFLDDEDTKIEKVNVVNDGIDSEWDMKEKMKVYSGSELKISVDAVDKKNLTKLGTYRKPLVVEYVCDGKTYAEITDIMIRTRLSAFQMYALEDDTIDYRKYMDENNQGEL